MARDDTPPDQRDSDRIGADDPADDAGDPSDPVDPGADGDVPDRGEDPDGDIDGDVDGDIDELDEDLGDEEPRPPSRLLMGVLAAVVAVALVLTGGALAVITGVGDGGSGRSTPGEGSVDVGFTRDMTRHHRQAVEMAGWVRDRSQDPAIRTLAYDMETTQFTQIGQMQGLLLSWGVSESSVGPPMQWMSEDAAHGGHQHELTEDGLMPGMATQAELDHLKSLQGTELDVYFLQLMLRHHQGGLPMAQDAVENASTSAVRTLANGMGNAQQNEIVVMEQLLRQHGATPLPPP